VLLTNFKRDFATFADHQRAAFEHAMNLPALYQTLACRTAPEGS
jgi:hypothetical protein